MKPTRGKSSPQGFRNEKDFREAKQLMDSLEYHDFLGREIALKAASNFRKPRKAGIRVRKTIDVIISTFCMENGCELIHNDKDFDAMERHLGLVVRK